MKRLYIDRRGHLRAQTFKACEQCGCVFGPLDHLCRRFCCYECKSAAQRVQTRKPRPIPTLEARRAQRRVAYLVALGRITKPETCQKCGAAKRLEAAHRDYALPEEVMWLCVSCHRRWDWALPKGGTIPTVNRAEGSCANA